MVHYGLTPEHSFDSVDVNPIQCTDTSCGDNSLTHYTLAGIYNSATQARTTKDTYDYLYKSLIQSCG